MKVEAANKDKLYVKLILYELKQIQIGFTKILSPLCDVSKVFLKVYYKDNTFIVI